MDRQDTYEQLSLGWKHLSKVEQAAKTEAIKSGELFVIVLRPDDEVPSAHHATNGDPSILQTVGSKPGVFAGSFNLAKQPSTRAKMIGIYVNNIFGLLKRRSK